MSAISLPAAASVLTRVMSWPPGARTISTLISGKRLLNSFITSCSARAGSAFSGRPRAAIATIRATMLAFMSTHSLSFSSYSLRDAALGCPPREPVRAADENPEQHRLHQAEGGGLAEVSALVIVEQQHRHHHGVAGVEKQR